jgi:hypothetical protein
MNLLRTGCVLLCIAFLLGAFLACKKEEEPLGEPSPRPALAPPAQIPAIEEPTGYDKAPTLTPATEDTLTYTAENGSVTVTGYTGQESAVQIPEQIDGLPVRRIADAAFSNSTLTALALPMGLLEIGKGILEGASALSYLHTPFLGQTAADTQYLGYLFGASSYKDNPLKVPAALETLSLGEGLQSIPDYAFFDCNDLEAILLPKTVDDVGKFSFYHCRSLRYIPLESVESIAEYAFRSCEALTVLSLGRELTSIGLGAFEGCDALRRMTLPFVGGGTAENAYLAYIFGASVPEFSKGYYPGMLSEIILLPGCGTVGTDAFYECKSLVSVQLPQGVASIGSRAFYGCSNLRGITIPATVTSIGENAFFYCSYLAELTFAEGASLSSIGMNAFYDCRSLTEVALPEALRALPSSCFAGCDALERIRLGGVLSVGTNAFRGCASLKEVFAKDGISFASGNSTAASKLAQ